MEHYKYSCSYTADTVFLHDSYAEIRILGDNEIGISFDEGFIITKSNPHNTSGRELQTGSSFMLLKDAGYRKGTAQRPAIPGADASSNNARAEYSDIPSSEIEKHRIFINYFIFSKEEMLCYISGSIMTGSEYGWPELDVTVNCSDIICFWNECYENSWSETCKNRFHAGSAMKALGLTRINGIIYADENSKIYYRFIGENEYYHKGKEMCVSDCYALYYSCDPDNLINGIFEKGYSFEEGLSEKEFRDELGCLLKKAKTKRD